MSYRTPHGRDALDAGTARLASVLAEPARAAMLWALSDGRALPAGELARLARIRPATASAHLAKLVGAALVAVESSGRHRYYRLAQPELVLVLEALATLDVTHIAPAAAPSRPTGIRLARTCYDHLAGSAGVRITAALLASGRLIESETGYDVTPGGSEWFAGLGIDLVSVRARAKASRRVLARACLDWSERRHHLAGVLGAELCTRLLHLRWFERLPSTRALRVTPAGRRELRRQLEIVLL